MEFCLKNALVHEDADGELLARLLLIMSKTQRIKIATVVV